MRRITLPSATLLSLAVFASACAWRGPSEPELRADLAGTWVLNETESQSPQRPGSSDGREGRAGRAPDGRGLGSPGRNSGRGGGGMRGRGMSPGSVSAESAESMRRALIAIRAASRIQIMQDDSSIRVVHPDSSTLQFSFDGKKRKLAWKGVGEIEARAKWDDGFLEVDRTLDGGPQVHELYARAPGSSRLIIATTVTGGGREALSLRRVYDAQ